MDGQAYTSENPSIEAQHAFIVRVTGYSFHSSILLKEALDTNNFRSPEANGRLAMIGISRIQDVILDDWFVTGAPTNEASKRISVIGSKANLARAAKQIGLGRDLIVLDPDHTLKVTDILLATAMEAVFGAIYWHSRNEQAVRRAMIKTGVFACELQRDRQHCIEL